MGKSKAQRKQEKKDARQQIKNQVQDKSQDTKNTVVEESGATTKAKYEPEQLNLTPYTAIYMLATLVAAATVMLSMVMLAKPEIYFLESMIGTGMDNGDIGGTFYLHFSIKIYEIVGKGQVYGAYISVAVLSLVTLVLTMIGMSRATKPDRKPLVILDIIATICALAAILLFIFEGRHLYDFMLKDELGGMIACEPIWGVYRILYVLLVCNVIFVIANVVMGTIALKRWNKTGTTTKSN